MPFIEKEIEFGQFMKQLRQRLEKRGDSAALSFFKFFLEEELPKELKHQAAINADFNSQIVVTGDFDEIYPIAVEILHDAAARNDSEANPDIYQQASAVSSAFCDELNELFQCSEDNRFNLIPIKSYSQMMAKAGLVNLTRGSDGQTMVSLSKKGEGLAHEVGQQIKQI